MSLMPAASLRSLKSRLGCRTCKIRRVKCGEEKPHCQRCTSTGRKCEYEASSSPPLAITATTSGRERRAFAYYFESAAASLGGDLDRSFWRTTVPQVCRHEPAVWDAIISIGALFESPDPCPDLVVRRHALNQNHRDALGWYARAVSTVRQRIERGGVDLFIGLISCVLFLCIEALQGGVDEAVRLYGQGVHLIGALRAQIAAGLLPASRAPLLEDIVVPIFARLSVIAFTTAGLPASQILRRAPGDLAAPTAFPSLQAARDTMMDIVTDAQLFERACGDHLRHTYPSQVPPAQMEQHRALSARLAHWHTAFTQWTQQNDAAPTLYQRATQAALVAHSEMLTVMLAVCVTASQLVTDAYLPQFQHIVDEATVALQASTRADGSQSPYTFDVSVGFPLWFTTLRCREPRLRRIALALLRRAPAVQGFYRSNLGANMAESIMLVEEAYGRALHGVAPGAAAPVLSSREHLRPTPADLDPPVDALILDPATYTSRLIPEQARIMPAGVFRRQDGRPPGLTDAELARWHQGADQPLLRMLRKEHDRATDSWTVIHEYIPIDQ